MIEKIKKTILKALDRTGKMKVRGLPRGLVITLILLIILCVLLYISGWVYTWYCTGKVEFVAMNDLLKTITGTAFIAAIAFLAKALIDEDSNGIPDEWERDDSKDAKSDVKGHSDNGQELMAKAVGTGEQHGQRCKDLPALDGGQVRSTV
ncbi:hypothetical protein [Acidaminococcus timonensis]|uniref:hypothetical protein n=1 Tax=Acidaminococcus timonensis TaxID=1871002 RepID=UPI00307B0707